MAYWNLHERHLELVNGLYMVNEVNPLILFHFSNYKVKSPLIISRYYNRLSLEDLPVLKKLYLDYASELKGNNLGLFRSVECVYTKSRGGFLKNLIQTVLSKLAGFTNSIYQKVIRM